MPTTLTLHVFTATASSPFGKTTLSVPAFSKQDAISRFQDCLDTRNAINDVNDVTNPDLQLKLNEQSIQPCHDGVNTFAYNPDDPNDDCACMMFVTQRIEDVPVGVGPMRDTASTGGNL